MSVLDPAPWLADASGDSESFWAPCDVLAEHLPRPADLEPLWPAAVAGFILMAASALLVRGGHRVLGGIATAFALPVALGMAYWRVAGVVPPWPATQSTERVVWAALGVGIAGAALAVTGGRDRLSSLVPYGMAAGLVWWVLRPLLERAPDVAGALPAGTAFVIVGGILVFWAAAAALLEHVRGPFAVLGLGIATGALGQLLFLFGGGLLAQLMGGLSLALIPGAFLCFVVPERRLPVTLAAGAVGAIAAILLDAWAFMDETPDPQILLLPLLGIFAAAPFLWKRLRRGPAWLRVVSILLLMAIPAVIALYRGAEQVPPPLPDDPYADFYK